jgi:nitroimidazol reductase NimA-like FMN-containing flavoprotein (pyridoxamine 5'-phosphate oxidase superfamily)
MRPAPRPGRRVRYPRAMDDTTASEDANSPEDATTPATPRGPAVPPAPRTDRTRIRRHADRAVPDRIEEFLRAGTVAHVALVENGEPRLIPLLYHYETGHIYLHGSPGNATLRLLRDGRSVAVAVTQLVELVASKTAADHSANYRSVVAFGRGHQVADVAEKRRVLDAMTGRYFPGRTTPADYAPATNDDLVRMELTDVEIDEASAKMREGGPMGPHDSDPEFPGSAFIKLV